MKILVLCFGLLVAGIGAFPGTVYSGSKGTEYYLKGEEAEKRQDYQKAGEYYLKACEMASGEGCRAMALLLEKLKVEDRKLIATLLVKACRLDDIIGCALLPNYQDVLLQTK